MSKKKLLTWFFIVLVAGLIGYQKITTYINGQIAVKMRGRPTAVELGVVKEGSIKDKVESAGRIKLSIPLMWSPVFRDGCKNVISKKALWLIRVLFSF